MEPEQVLAYAQQVYEELQYGHVSEFDWLSTVNELVDSGMFTVPQAAKIAGRNPAYVQRVVSKQQGTLDAGKRSRGGVSGNFNPESLRTLRFLRTQWFSRRKHQRIDSATRDNLVVLLNEGNGVRLIEHITTIPAAYLYRLSKELREK